MGYTMGKGWMQGLSMQARLCWRGLLGWCPLRPVLLTAAGAGWTGTDPSP